MTLQRVSQNCLRSSAAHSGCIPPTKYAFLFMPGAPSSLPSGLFGCCSGADSFNSNFFRLRFEVSTHSLFSTDCMPSFLFSSAVSGLVFAHFRAYASSSVCQGGVVYRQKKGGGSARFHHSARCASKWRRPNHKKSYAMLCG